MDFLDDTLSTAPPARAHLVDEVMQYEDAYRLCHVRGLEGILGGLAEHIG
jgi:hypothetical protein